MRKKKRNPLLKTSNMSLNPALSDLQISVLEMYAIFSAYVTLISVITCFSLNDFLGK